MKVTIYATLSETSLSYIDLKDLADIGKIANHLSIFTSDMSKHGYVVVGTTEVDIDLLPPDQIIGNAVLALRAKAAEIRAEATARVTALESKAQQLLAIENKVPA